MNQTVIYIYDANNYQIGNPLYRWQFATPTFYDLQQGFLKRFGNLVSDYPRMFMRNRVHKATDLPSFIDALNRSKYFHFEVNSDLK
jgi:hypothetical protein